MQGRIQRARGLERDTRPWGRVGFSGVEAVYGRKNRRCCVGQGEAALACGGDDGGGGSVVSSTAGHDRRWSGMVR